MTKSKETIQTAIVYVGLALIFGWVVLACTSIPSQASTRKSIESLVLGQASPSQPAAAPVAKLSATKLASKI